MACACVAQSANDLEDWQVTHLFASVSTHTYILAYLNAIYTVYIYVFTYICSIYILLSVNVLEVNISTNFVFVSAASMEIFL